MVVLCMACKPYTNRPEMSDDRKVSAKCTQWKLLADQGRDAEAQRVLNDIQFLQWKLGRQQS